MYIEKNETILKNHKNHDTASKLKIIIDKMLCFETADISGLYYILKEILFYF